VLQSIRKGTRSHAARQSPAQFEAGSVFFPKSAPWLDSLKAELLGFPNVKYDDQVDSVTQALSWIARHRQTGAVIRLWRATRRWHPCFWWHDPRIVHRNFCDTSALCDVSGDPRTIETVNLARKTIQAGRQSDRAKIGTSRVNESGLKLAILYHGGFF
jgi:hypothetical protein